MLSQPRSRHQTPRTKFGPVGWLQSGTKLPITRARRDAAASSSRPGRRFLRRLLSAAPLVALIFVLAPPAHALRARDIAGAMVHPWRMEDPQSVEPPAGGSATLTTASAAPMPRAAVSYAGLTRQERLHLGQLGARWPPGEECNRSLRITGLHRLQKAIAARCGESGASLARSCLDTMLSSSSRSAFSSCLSSSSVAAQLAPVGAAIARPSESTKCRIGST